jgi:hypothetical protein
LVGPLRHMQSQLVAACCRPYTLPAGVPVHVAQWHEVPVEQEVPGNLDVGPVAAHVVVGSVPDVCPAWVIKR